MKILLVLELASWKFFFTWIYDVFSNVYRAQMSFKKLSRFVLFHHDGIETKIDFNKLKKDITDQLEMFFNALQRNTLLVNWRVKYIFCVSWNSFDCHYRFRVTCRCKIFFSHFVWTQLLNDFPAKSLDHTNFQAFCQVAREFISVYMFA